MITCILIPFNAYSSSKVNATTITSLSAKSAGFKVKWKKVNGATGYQIQYSTSNKFTKNTRNTIKINKYSTTSKTVSGLKNKNKYYVRVRTYKKYNDKTLYSSWSKAKSVTTKIKNTTTNKIEHKDNSITISWKKVADINGYQIKYSTSSKQANYNTIKIKKSSITTKKINNLKYAKTYYISIRTYKIIAKKTYYSSWSDIIGATTTKSHKWDAYYISEQVCTTEAYDEEAYTTYKQYIWVDKCETCDVTELDCDAESIEMHCAILNHKKSCKKAYVSLGTVTELTATIHHDAEYKTREIFAGYKCSCGKTKSA